MKSNTAMYLKFAVGVILFLSWMALVMLHTAFSDDIISFIKLVLVGLASHMLTVAGQPVVTFPATTATVVAPK